MMNRMNWTREQLLIAFKLYCQIPFGKMHYRNADIIDYAKLIGRTPSALAMKLTNIASLDPHITSTGRRGLRASSSADKAMWDEMQSDWDSFALEMQEAENHYGEISASAEIGLLKSSEFNDSIDYSGINRVIQATTRVGQGFFRRAVLSAYDSQCCITGLSIPELLVASHIIPWRVDEKNRINPRNGLCLSTIHDRAFDLGIITISDEMSVTVSKRCRSSNDSFLRMALTSYEGKPIRLPEKFQPDPKFLSYHRQHVFQE